MTKNPIPIKSRTLQPTSLDGQKRELLTEVGRAVVNLSIVENCCANLAYQASFPRADMKVADMFFAIAGFEKRLQFADLMMELFAEEANKKRWEAITGELNKHRGIRNFLAHNPLSSSLLPNANGAYDVFLTAQDLARPFKSRKTKGLAEIRSTASALERIRDDLEKLWNDIDDRRLHEEQEDKEE